MPGATTSGLARWSSAVGPRERERCDRVVGAVRRAHVAGGTDRQHPRSISRRGYAAVLRVPFRAATVVSGSGDHGDARADRTLSRKRKRIGVVRLVHARRDREIDDTEVERIAASHRVVDRGDDVADVPPAAFVEHLQDDEMRARRDAGSRAVRVEPVAGDDACHVRAVAVVVVRRRHSIDKIDELDDALPHFCIRQVIVPTRDARVDHRDADPCAIDAQVLPCRHGADRRARAIHRPHDHAIQRHAVDERAGREDAKRRIRHDGHLALDRR